MTGWNLGAILGAVTVLAAFVFIGAIDESGAGAQTLKPFAPAAQHEDEATLRARAEKLHRDAIVIDGHNDVMDWVCDYGFDLGMDGADPRKWPGGLYTLLPTLPALGWLLPKPRGDELRTDTDLRRLRAGGVKAVFFAILADTRCVGQGFGRCLQLALTGVSAIEEQVRRLPTDLEVAKTADDVRRIARSGRIAALIAIEGGHAIEDNLDNLQVLYDRGARMMTLTWQNTNDWADSSNDRARHNGLSDFGRRVVARMNQIGMIVDVSHVSDETFWDVIKTTSAPIVASHSAARALANNPRNMSDDMLRAVGRNGGVVMVNFSDIFVDPEKAAAWSAGGAFGYAKMASFVVWHLGWARTPLSALIDQIDHVARVAGIDHVGLGSDFDGSPRFPKGVEDVSGYPNITLGLLRRGYSEDNVRKILGENALRVMSQVEATARSMQGQNGTR